MPLGTLDRNPPPFFRQGPSALTRVSVFSAVAIFLMVADARLEVARPVRSVVATALYPLQWLALRPVILARFTGSYFEDLQVAQGNEAEARIRLATQSRRAGLVEELSSENDRLRKLLALRDQVHVAARAAEVVYDAADPYSRKVFIDKGAVAGVMAGSSVMDEAGVLGQVTRVHPLMSEVTLVIDRDLSIPILNSRTGVRSIAFGEPALEGGMLELRFVAPSADVKEGDLLTTSGVDGVYPPGLPVAHITRVERRADSPFARIYCKPLALVAGSRYVMVLDPVGAVALPPATSAPAPARSKPGRPGAAP